MITTPPYLQPGDTIGIVCPAGFMPMEKVETCVRVLRDWGYTVHLGATVGHQHHYFSGTDAERLADLQAMLDNPNIKAILCARGGYGTSRIVDALNWEAFQQQPKWIIGYSDITVLHSFLYTHLRTAGMHAPMAGAFNHDGWQNAYVQSLRHGLQGQPAAYEVANHPRNRVGTAVGALVGGNLSLMAHQIGTPSDVNTEGCILFLEDVGEYLYNIDRMLLQLQRAGKLAPLAGLIVGGFTDNKDTTEPFGQSVEEIIYSHVTRYNFPVCFGFPVSHTPENYCLKTGLTHQLRVGETVTLTENRLF
jgi:muramoyltetrapeptide carboxypeptidase